MSQKRIAKGIIYVTSRMEWYWTLSELIFEENKPQVDGESFTGLQCELKSRIVDLYRTLLSYQMRSVCSYFWNRGLALLGDIIRLDNWNGSLKTVQEQYDKQRDSCSKTSMHSLPYPRYSPKCRTTHVLQKST